MAAPRYKVRDQGVAVVGLQELTAALARIGGAGEFGIDYEMRRRLVLIGEEVAKDAPRYVTHKTDRHGDPNEPRLEDSVRVSVTRAGASVYSTAIYGGAQNVGGQVGRKRRTLLKRADVSRWMIRAVGAAAPMVRDQTEKVLEWLVGEFEGAGYI